MKPWIRGDAASPGVPDAPSPAPAWPLVLTDRSLAAVTFEDEAALLEAIPALGSVTVGKLVTALRGIPLLSAWQAIFRHHGNLARLSPSALRTAAFMCREHAAKEGLRDVAEEFHERVAGEGDFEDWWERKGPTGPTGGPPTGGSLPDVVIVDDLAGAQGPSPGDIDEAFLASVRRLPEVKDARLEGESVVAEVVVDAPAPPPRRPRGRPRSPSLAAVSNPPPTEPLGEVSVPVRRAGKKAASPVVCLDYYGDGHYEKPCPCCGNIYTFEDGYGHRVVDGPQKNKKIRKKVPHSWCTWCRKEAPKKTAPSAEGGVDVEE